MIRHFVSVILPLPLKQLFTYELEEAEYQFLLPGMRVAVPFGKSKVYTALVYSLENTFEGTYEPKRILSILDATPIVTEIQLKHWSWMADYYMCALGEVYKTAVPTALILEGETHLRRSDILKRDHDALIAGLSDNAYIVLDALSSDVSLPIQTLSTLVQNDNIFNIIEVLLNLKLVVVEEQLTAR
ncbi:primosomal protein N', partial [Flavobacteriaceae bacterium]|nr:primosomal protein N' [Flavobacteriaceae bacterium]